MHKALLGPPSWPTGAFVLTVTLSDDSPGTATVTGSATVGAGTLAAVPALDARGLFATLLGWMAAGAWILRSR